MIACPVGESQHAATETGPGAIGAMAEHGACGTEIGTVVGNLYDGNMASREKLPYRGRPARECFADNYVGMCLFDHGLQVVVVAGIVTVEEMPQHAAGSAGLVAQGPVQIPHRASEQPNASCGLLPHDPVAGSEGGHRHTMAVCGKALGMNLEHLFCATNGVGCIVGAEEEYAEFAAQGCRHVLKRLSDTS